MGDYVTLLGSEDVVRAGHNISGAADTMNRAAENFGYHVDRLEQILTTHIAELDRITTENSK